MNKALVLALAVTLTGCALDRTVMIHVEGENIRSPYANGDGTVIILKNTEWGICQVSQRR